ncbi:MAG: catalase [Ruminococcus sp.]|nr:catalase [Ruminococcus sp.]
MIKAAAHFRTITKHKMLVMKECFQVGLYRQGLLHDLSKYTWTEFLVGCRFYQGSQSPNNAERKAKGCSLAWLHHKGRNKHHYEYWVDYGLDGTKRLIGMRMPVKYVVEMFLDRIAASKVYKGSAYRDSDPLDYFRKGGTDDYVMHEETKKLLTGLLRMLAEKGEEFTFRYIRENVLGKRKGIGGILGTVKAPRIHRRYIQV